MPHPLQAMTALGQSPWYDNIERRLLQNGELAAMLERDDIRGVTSNPSIFHNAIARSHDYDAELGELAKKGLMRTRYMSGLSCKIFVMQRIYFYCYISKLSVGMGTSAWR